MINFQSRPRRLLAALIALLVVLFLVFQVAVHVLKGQIEKALGPSGEVHEIRHLENTFVMSKPYRYG